MRRSRTTGTKAIDPLRSLNLDESFLENKFTYRQSMIMICWCFKIIS